ncbi:hypothetical protein ACPUD8_14125 [Brevibacterium sp. FAM 25378]|uniref:hypothetical protein n=1 Tax=unclassified Brevibacterium TaxID=2614124 RepID=UPI001092CC50|nr:hypothetical protein [Brevibacterium sp. S22]TGD30013.1 hypothetical protein EB835_14345 [Brevibacterium sp. S22]
MEIRTRSIRNLAYRCEEFIDGSGKPRPIGYPNSLALCILDALFTTGSHPTAIDNLLNRYIARHGSADGAKMLRYSIATAGGPEVWAREVIRNVKPAHSHPGAILRAEIVDRATRLMADHGIDTVEDLLGSVGDEPSSGRHTNEVARDWRELPSQKSGISWNALLVLAGSAHLEIDYRVNFLIAEVVRWSVSIRGDDAVLELIKATADYLDVEDRVVKQIVWQLAHRRLQSDPKRRKLDLPYPLDDELDSEPEWWPGTYDPEVRGEAEGWASVFEPEYRADPCESEEALEPDWARPYPMSGTTGAAPF